MDLVATRIPNLEDILQGRKKRIVIAMLTVFGDESADEKAQRVFAVAGIMGSQEEWDELTIPWLERTGGKAFHAADCEADAREYKGIPHEENLKLYADLVKLLAKTNMLGYGVAVDIQAHRQFFPHNIENDPYPKCFLLAVVYFVQRAYIHIPRQEVKFTFDLSSERSASCTALYEYMRKTSDWKFGPYLNEIAFASRNDFVGIQAADIIARETMKYFDNFLLGPRKYPIRESMKALMSTQRYRFHYLSRTYFENFKKEFPKEEQISLNQNYKKWLEKNRVIDNAVNRNRFLLETRVNRE